MLFTVGSSSTERSGISLEGRGRENSLYSGSSASAARSFARSASCAFSVSRRITSSELNSPRSDDCRDECVERAERARDWARCKFSVRADCRELLIGELDSGFIGPLLLSKSRGDPRAAGEVSGFASIRAELGRDRVSFVGSAMSLRALSTV